MGTPYAPTTPGSAPYGDYSGHPLAVATQSRRFPAITAQFGAVQWQEIVILVGGMLAFTLSFFPWELFQLDYGDLYRHTATLNAWGYWSGDLTALVAASLIVYSILAHFKLAQWLPKPGITILILGVVALFGLGAYLFQATHALSDASAGLSLKLMPTVFIAIVPIAGAMIAGITLLL